ncbi:SigE family RNA polymerase sigma factor [Nonomuraea sp. FMUSA5-5]|uniref:SigE family RNA polymerase sigma factor n=1 Tax=Nonomuraea composti TaxID=2720023 RepID=A0ABX1B6V8_9ACTN|nr:SigE family RNA polymerase sigma factor [Nonomuraea sp. FMUSA5-5]NJP93191.1 SigE family RNA polymerase sigma factor [Nonomuraea sp. FMUSA5-5]
MDGDPRYADFVAERGDALLRYGYVLAGNPHDAADLVQEALLRLRGAWPRLRSKESPESYVRTTMARLHLSVWRLRRRELLAWDLPDGTHEDTLPRGDERTLWQALSGLPRKQRAVLVLRYYEQLTDAEIANVLGISRGTVRSQASRALDKLRAAVPAEDLPPPALTADTRPPAPAGGRPHSHLDGGGNAR